MEVDWGKRYLDHYLTDGDKILQHLTNGEVNASFLEHSLHLLGRFLDIPRHVSNQAVDEMMVQIAQALYPHIQPRGYWNYIASWWPKVKVIAEQLPDLTMKAEVIKELAIVKNIQGESKEAQKLYEQLITSPDFELLPSIKQVDILHQVGVCYLRQGNYRKSHDALLHCVTISEADHHWEFKAYALNQLGNIALLHGDFDKAHNFYDESLVTFTLSGEGNNLACVAYQSLGRLSVVQRRFTEAISLLEEARAIRHRRQEEEGAAHCAIYLAAAYIECNRLDEAESLLTEALKTCKKLRDQRGEAMCHLNFCYLETKRGDSEAALTQWRQALILLEIFSVPTFELLVLVMLLPQLLRTGRIRESYSPLLHLINNLRSYPLNLVIRLFLKQTKRFLQRFLLFH